QLVVEVGAEEMAVGGRKLVAHQAAHHARGTEEAQRGHDEAKADGLVAVGAEEAEDARLIAPRALELGSGRRSRAFAIAQMPARACFRLRFFARASARTRLRGKGPARGGHCSAPR